MTEIHLDPSKRHDFVLLFDVADGNPNGDPDAGNLPRLDPETMQGLVTDVAIKRKVRDYIAMTRAGRPGHRIFINNRAIALNTLIAEAYPGEKGAKAAGAKRRDPEALGNASAYMAREFADVRLFGAVMTTGLNAGQVRGPFQLTFARSLHPVVPLDVSITRVAITKPEDAAVDGEDGEGSGKGKRTEMGRKPLVPYGLYRASGFYNPHFGKATGISSDDLALFWEALQRAWDLDRSAARGMMSCRGIHVFSHENPYGDAPAHALFERVKAHLKDDKKPPRAYDDYVVQVDGSDLPKGVRLTSLTW